MMTHSVRRTMLVVGASGAIALAAAGCGGSAKVTANRAVGPTAATPYATTSPEPASSATGATTAPSTTADVYDTTTTASALGPCQAEATANTYVHINTATAGAGGALSIVANPTTLVCGGEDDLHYNIGSSTETGKVLAGATIQVQTNSGQPQPLPEAQLPAYLRTDQQTRVFLVTGPLTAITALQEQFHP